MLNPGDHILITGGSGALGTALVAECENTNIPYLAPTHEELDVTHEAEISDYIQQKNIGAIIHSAAVVDWVKIHEQPDLALQTNCQGTVNISRVANEIGAHLVYVSTDAVFAGTKSDSEYSEKDAAGDPVSFYGMTKIMGEWASRLYCNSLTISRLGWLFGPSPQTDQKFVGLIVKQIGSGNKEILAVDDKYGSPTFAKHAAQKLIYFAQNKTSGTRHVANSGVASRYDVARYVAQLWGDESVQVTAVKSDSFPSIIKRPDYSGLTTIYEDSSLPSWQNALEEYHAQFPTSLGFSH